MKNGTGAEDWRTKYFDSLGSLESEQQQFRAMEATLKRFVGRLCSASLGQSPRLDAEIRKLQQALRSQATSDELDQITPTLSDAIQALDHSTPALHVVATQSTRTQPDAPNEVFDDEQVRATLSAMLVELRRDPELLDQVDALDSKLETGTTRGQLPEILSSLTTIVGQRIHRIERSKHEIETLLSQMVGKLDEISQFVAEQNQNQSQSQASNETLNTQLVGEMKAMGESVESADDLRQIRTQVRSRLESIDRHLQEFRRRETTRTDAMRARNEQMRARVAALEAEANRLHDQLKDEQRLSTIDLLTKIPNRLAYEKRIDEELNRWQRFNQPACIAVLDVDHFKRINDTCGHRAGDRVLSVVSKCLADRIRGTDFVARYGGEEFVMILTGTDLANAVRLVDEMRIAVSLIGFHFRGTPLPITISSGITALQAGDSSSSVFDRADKAMYQAKESGRNRCVGI
ncbi:MAG TPA: diguanylate cyclase [Steroidobacteraceae bacterium]